MNFLAQEEMTPIRGLWHINETRAMSAVSFGAYDSQRPTLRDLWYVAKAQRGLSNLAEPA